jgi:hypothetical protein
VQQGGGGSPGKAWQRRGVVSRRLDGADGVPAADGARRGLGLVGAEQDAQERRQCLPRLHPKVYSWFLLCRQSPCSRLWF